MFRNNFYPRTLQESATAVEAFSDALRMISIHAPYKRVRHLRHRGDQRQPRNFNPRTLQESATAIYSKKIDFSQYIGLKILIRNKKYPSLKVNLN